MLTATTLHSSIRVPLVRTDFSKWTLLRVPQLPCPISFEPQREKTNNLVSDQVTQTRLYSHCRWPEAWNFVFRKKGYCTIQVAKTKALISFAFCFRICKLLVFSFRGSFLTKTPKSFFCIITTKTVSRQHCKNWLFWWKRQITWASLWENRSSGFPTWSDTIWAVQAHKMIRALKFWI